MTTATKTAYEFLGDLWHGCPTCYPDHRSCNQPGMTYSAEEAYKALNEKRKYYNHLKSLIPDLKVVEVWEKDFERQRATDDALHDYITARLNFLQKN